MLVVLSSLDERLRSKRRESRGDAVRDRVSRSDGISKGGFNPRRPTYVQSCASLANAIEELRLYTHLYTDFVAHASILAQISRMCKSPQILLTFAHIVQVSPPICHKSQVTIGGCRSNPPMPCSPKLAAAQGAAAPWLPQNNCASLSQILRKCLRYAVSKTCACLAYLLYCKYLRKTCARLSDRWQIWHG